MMRQYLNTIADGGHLSLEDAEGAMHVLMRGEAPPEHVSAFLIGLRARGESLNELVGFTRVMRKYAVQVDAGDPDAIDLCGTGGDGSGTFNISTAASLVAAGAGVTVAKHGNRSVSSSCGSADVLEALGVRVELGKQGVEYCFEKAGIAFMFAPNFHPAMKHVMPIRRSIGVRTFFNILGPLCNPAGVRRQLTGAFDIATAQTMSAILQALDAKHVVAVHSDDGMDEISISAETTVFEYNSADQRDGRFEYVGDVELSEEEISTKGRQVSPEYFGLGRHLRRDIEGGSTSENARIISAILEGDDGPPRQVALLNAAFALHTSGKYSGIETCLDAARESIDSGAAKQVLQRLVEASNTAPGSS